MYYTFLI